jgi:HEAT repeat protein
MDEVNNALAAETSLQSESQQSSAETASLSPVQQAIAALNSTQVNVRQDAVATLAQADSAEAQEALVAALSHPLADVRRHVLFELSVKK